MTIKLNLQEKCYLIALYGDMSRAKRERLFSVSSFPPQAGPLVMADGHRFIGAMKKPSLFEDGTRNP